MVYKTQDKKQGFTLLELLLVMAIIAVIAGIITFALRPAENIQNATDVQTASKASDIEKAIQLYALDNNGTLPGNILSKTSISYEEICREDANSTDNCLDLNTLLPDYLSKIPIDVSRSTEDISGYILKYDPEGNSIDVMSASEYESKTDEILTEGLVGYWKMDEASWNGTAGEVVDSSGNGNDGTATLNSSLVGGKYGNAGSFDTDVDSIHVPNSNSLATGDIDFTIAAWFKIDSVNSTSYCHSIASKHNGSANRHEWALCLRYSRLEYLISPDTVNDTILVASSYGVPTTGEWVFVIAWHDSVNDLINIQVNNGPVDSLSYNQGVTPDLAPFRIARVSTGEQYTGVIDEVRFYKRVLSASERTLLYEWAPPPIAHWRFNEGSGSTTSDSSENENDLTLFAGANWSEGKYGSGLEFTKVNPYEIDTNIDDLYDMLASRIYTFEGWFKTSGATFFQLFSDYNANTGYAIWLDNGKLVLFTKGVSTNSYYSTQNSSFTDNQWHHFAVVSNRSSNTAQIYVDGILETSSGNVSSDDLSNSDNLRIGRTNNFSTGQSALIDDFRVYNYARTQAQIIEDMKNL